MGSKLKHIERELQDLDVQRGSVAWNEIYANASEAAEILSKRELTELIEQSLEQHSFADFEFEGEL